MSGRGTWKRVFEDKGYGFIAVEGERDLFAHIRDCELTDTPFVMEDGRDGRPPTIFVDIVRGALHDARS